MILIFQFFDNLLQTIGTDKTINSPNIPKISKFRLPMFSVPIVRFTQFIRQNNAAVRNWKNSDSTSNLYLYVLYIRLTLLAEMRIFQYLKDLNIQTYCKYPNLWTFCHLKYPRCNIMEFRKRNSSTFLSYLLKIRTIKKLFSYSLLKNVH